MSLPTVMVLGAPPPTTPPCACSAVGDEDEFAAVLPAADVLAVAVGDGTVASIGLGDMVVECLP